MNRPTVVDLFAGAGLFSYAFREEGFEIVQAVESNEFAADSYRSNLGDVLITKDILDASADRFLRRAHCGSTLPRILDAGEEKSGRRPQLLEPGAIALGRCRESTGGRGRKRRPVPDLVGVSSARPRTGPSRLFNRCGRSQRRGLWSSAKARACLRGSHSG